MSNTSYNASWTMCWLSLDHGALQIQQTCLLTGSLLPSCIGQCTFLCIVQVQLCHWSLPWLYCNELCHWRECCQCLHIPALLPHQGGYWWAYRLGCILAGTIDLIWWLSLLLCLIGLWSSHFLLWICWPQTQLHIGIHYHLSGTWYGQCC